jgi:hypothetical protein
MKKGKKGSTSDTPRGAFSAGAPEKAAQRQFQKTRVKVIQAHARAGNDGRHAETLAE